MSHKQPRAAVRGNGVRTTPQSFDPSFHDASPVQTTNDDDRGRVRRDSTERRRRTITARRRHDVPRRSGDGAGVELQFTPSVTEQTLVPASPLRCNIKLCPGDHKPSGSPSVFTSQAQTLRSNSTEIYSYFKLAL